jgi:hypothetical protein
MAALKTFTITHARTDGYERTGTNEHERPFPTIHEENYIELFARLFEQNNQFLRAHLHCKGCFPLQPNHAET